jgi:adenylate cyclase class 2
MPIEIEKKFRLTKKQRESALKRLPEIGATFEREEFEENTLYSGGVLDVGKCALRLRRVGDSAILTYKERFSSTSSIKQQREDETQIADADAMADILEALGFTPTLVYEKRRATWRLGQAEIVIDELPFGLFMEIEASEAEIRAVEKQLAIKGLQAVHETYAQMTLIHGEESGPRVEARFRESSK